MAKALFMGLSAAFFMGFSLIAAALDIGDGNTIIAPGITTSEQEQCIGVFITVCSTDFTGIPVIGQLLQAGSNVQEFFYQTFAPFFQLLTFQVPGLEAASIITIMIFGPLAFINAYIIFTAVRGST